MDLLALTLFPSFFKISFFLQDLYSSSSVTSEKCLLIQCSMSLPAALSKYFITAPLSHSASFCLQLFLSSVSLYFSILSSTVASKYITDWINDATALNCVWGDLCSSVHACKCCSCLALKAHVGVDIKVGWHQLSILYTHTHTHTK